MKKLNVLQFICPAGFYGAEMWILALAKNLERKRIDCQLAITHESHEQNIEVFNRYKALGLKSHKVPMRGRFDPRGILNLCRLIKNEKIDVIHTHGYKSDILGLIAARLAGIKALATPHGFENVKDAKLQLFIRLGSFALRHFDRVAPLSDELKSDMLKIKVKPQLIRLINNGVDLDEVETERNTSAPLAYSDQTEKKIGYVGQIAHRKNIGDLIKTFDKLYKEHKNIRLILVGDGPMRNELEQEAHSLNSASKIEFLGYRTDRLRIVKELDLFCMTSSLEGIPRVMMEAMAIGVPVAAYDIPGVDKLLIHEKTGLLAKFGDMDDLKKCWERLLFNKALADEIALNGRKHILDNFSAKRMADEYTNLYQEMITS